MSYRRLFSFIAALVLGLSLGALVSACTTPKNTLGTSESPCFRSLVPARGIVGQKARFIGVKLTNGSGFAHDLANLHHPVNLPESVRHSSELCIVGYTGQFRRDRLDDGSTLGAATGRLVVVVVETKVDKVSAIVVLSHAVLAFSRTFPFTR